MVARVRAWVCRQRCLLGEIELVMSLPGLLKTGAGRATAIAVVGLLVAVAGWGVLRLWTNAAPPAATSRTPAGQSQLAGRDQPAATIEIPRHVAELNKMAIATAQLPTRERQLELRGELAIDINRLVHVHARFPGQIAEIMTIEEATGTKDEKSNNRPLGFMDRVTRGQQMAILWSKDLGEKKSELVDALANLRLDQIAYDRLKEVASRGATSEQALREAERQIQVGEINVGKAERTLRSWQIGDEEIAKVEAEVDRIVRHQEVGRKDDPEWARVKITAPMDGTIVEKNVTIGDIVDTNADLFKIADLSVLTLWLHAYEEDLPYLEQLPRPIPVKIHLPANPTVGELPAAIESIGDIINPLEHMALLVGHVENPRGELRAGQFVTARVALLPEQGVVEIPTRALVEDGTESVVFVQESPGEYCFRPRRVSVARRYHDVVHIRSHLTDQEKAKGLQELHNGDRVAASETVQLKAALQQQLTSADASP